MTKRKKTADETFSALALTDEQRDEIESNTVIGLSIEEISILMDLSQDLIQPIHRKAEVLMKKNLLELQWSNAIAKNDTAMLIHLGKQLAGQTEKNETKHTVETVPFADLTRPELLDSIKRLEE